MINFIKNPNLPKGKVKSLICGEMPLKLYDFFNQRDIKVFSCGENKKIDPAVSFHADMAALHLGGNKIAVHKNRKTLIESLSYFGMDVIKSNSEIKGEYPDDIRLNFAIVGNYVIGNEKHIDLAVRENLTDFQMIVVKQGYAKCSVLPVSQKAFITDDASIFHKCLNYGFDVLLIEKGDVLLKGHNYGFIGGAAGKISANEVLFFGDLSLHRNAYEIKGFLKKYGCEAITLKNSPLTDIGGIIALTEEV